MASACVNNIGVSPDNFLDCPTTYSSFGWLSPRVSFSREDSMIKSSTASVSKPSDLESVGNDAGDFEFRLDNPVTMLPADELFSDGKLVPLELSSVKSSQSTTSPEEVRSPETVKCRRKIDGGGNGSCLSDDPFLFSPKAPRCSSRWRELFGLKKKLENAKTTSSSSSSCTTTKSIRLFLHKNPKATFDPSLNVPLLKDTAKCCESLSVSSSRVSLSSTSSSSHDFEDLPRLSLDADKPTRSSTSNPNPTRIRMRPVTCRVGRSPVRRAQQDPATITRGVSVDSPRMNSSGKVVFQGLERSSSSPSSFNGSRPRYWGMERSYSANVVRVTPVLNVPVCSLRGSSKSGVFGFGQLFYSSSTQSQKREGSAAATTTIRHHQHHQSSGRSRKEGS